VKQARSKDNREIFADTSLASYHYETQSILLNEMTFAEFEQDKQSNDISEFTRLVTHETQHWLDHISSTWGQSHLIRWFSALNVAGLPKYENRFWNVPIAKKDFAYFGYDSYYNTTEGYPIANGQGWQMEQTVGFAFNHQGKISRETPILFCSFFDESRLWKARCPISIRALTEVTATTVELISRFIMLRPLAPEVSLVERQLIRAELDEFIHDPGLIEYTTLFHITAYFLDKTCLDHAASFAFPLAILALNLLSTDFETLAGKPVLAQPAEVHGKFCTNHNRGYAFYYFILTLANRRTEWKTSREACDVLLVELGYKSWRDFVSTIVGHRSAKRSELIPGRFHRHCETLLNLGDEVLVSLNGCDDESFFQCERNLESQLRSAPVVFADDKLLNRFSALPEVGWHDFKPWCEQIQNKSKWMDEFLRGCIA